MTIEAWAAEYLRMVEDCEKRNSKLNDWELGFVASMRGLLENNHKLTFRQSDTFDRIWNKATRDG